MKHDYQKRTRRYLSVFLCLLLVLSLLPKLPAGAAAERSSEDEPVITEIRIKTLPAKLTYLQYQDELDVTGGVLALYGPVEDEDSEENLRPRPGESVNGQTIELIGFVNMQSEWVSGFDNTVLGVQTLTVTYQGLTASFSITVIDGQEAPELTGIQIARKPDKCVYNVGETELDVTGGELALVYSNLSREIIPLTLDMVNLNDFQTSVVEDRNIRVSYGGFTASFKILIRSLNQVNKITLIQLPDKLVYLEGGEDLDVTGGRVSVEYFADETPEDLDLERPWVTGFNNSEAGEQLLTVVLGSASATFSVTVEHDYEEEIVAPTCTETGCVRLTCRVCGNVVEKDVTAALGHDYEVYVKEPTCTEGGFTRLTCRVCGDLVEQDLTDPLGHDYAEQTLAPTCTEEGYTLLTCSVCGDTVKQDVTAPLGHDYQTHEEPATCTNSGYLCLLCARCGDMGPAQDTDPPLGHDWSEPVYVWSEDCSTVTASCVCSRDASHILEEQAAAVLEVTTAPTYMTEGAGVCTAVFSDEHFSEQSLEVVLAPLPLPCDGSALCPGAVFTDMPKKSNWAHDAIDWAYVTGVTAGTTATTFSPKGNCTRGQVVTFLWRAAGSPTPKTTANPFTDVKKSAFYYKAVLWAVEEGITSGLSSTTFGPGKACTRGQFVTFLWRYLGCPEAASSQNPFTDVKKSAFYYKAVLWAAETGVTTGLTATTFGPGNTCTRAHVVTFLYRALS